MKVGGRPPADVAEAWRLEVACANLESGLVPALLTPDGPMNIRIRILWRGMP